MAWIRLDLPASFDRLKTVEEEKDAKLEADKIRDAVKTRIQ